MNEGNIPAVKHIITSASGFLWCPPTLVIESVFRNISILSEPDAWGMNRLIRLVSLILLPPIESSYSTSPYFAIFSVGLPSQGFSNSRLNQLESLLCRVRTYQVLSFGDRPFRLRCSASPDSIICFAIIDGMMSSNLNDPDIFTC